MSLPSASHSPGSPNFGKKFNSKTIILIVFVALLTIFAVQNWKPVYVWPLGSEKPLIIVIGFSLLMGGIIGWLAHSIMAGRRYLAPDEVIIEKVRR